MCVCAYYYMVSLNITCNTLEVFLGFWQYQLVCFLPSEAEGYFHLCVHNNEAPWFPEPPLTMSCNTSYWCKVSILSHFLQGWNNGLLDVVFLTAFHLLHMWTIPPTYSSYQRHSGGALHLSYKHCKILLHCFPFN